MELARGPFPVTVDKNDQFGAADRHRQFRGELVARKHFDVGARIGSEQLHRDLPTQAVIGPKGIAVAHDENACHITPPVRSAESPLLV
jgi:hypothetical protein